MDPFSVIACIVPSILSLGFVLWRERSTQRLIDKLTSKIIAKNYVEYATYQAEEVAAEFRSEPIPKKPATAPPLCDSVLGRTF